MNKYTGICKTSLQTICEDWYKSMFKIYRYILCALLNLKSIAIMQDFQQTCQKGKKQSPCNKRLHKLKNKKIINHLRKLAFSSTISFEGLQNSGEKCDESAHEQ